MPKDITTRSNSVRQGHVTRGTCETNTLQFIKACKDTINHNLYLQCLGQFNLESFIFLSNIHKTKQ